ncbi:hypothetical protein M5689_006784 [Euphorbia peplus]|nr:hypothetical protein M5689_006784 [Euphorbia peplus]
MEEPVENIIDLTEENHVNDTDNLMGMVVHTEEEAYNLYNSYDIRTGFSIRKSRKRVSVDGTIRHREYCCSKENEKYDKDMSTKQRQTLETRIGCRAMIRFSFEDGKWRVTKFISGHNHELALQSEVHMLRSNRKLTSSKINVIDSMVDACLRTIDVFSYLSKEAGGDENLDYKKRLLQSCS